MLSGLRIAALVDDGFEEVELVKPMQAFQQEGAKVSIVAPKHKIRSWRMKDWGPTYTADIQLGCANPYDFDALFIPGGIMSADQLKIIPDAVYFTHHFVDHEKPIVSICHGVSMLINAQGIKGKRVTSWPSLKVDLTNAGATWVDHPCVISDRLVTSRKPQDIPFFVAASISLFRKVGGKGTKFPQNPKKQNAVMNSNKEV